MQLDFYVIGFSYCLSYYYPVYLYTYCFLVLMTGSPTDYRPVDLLCQCIEQVKDWMCQHFLQLNKDKTEIIVLVSRD